MKIAHLHIENFKRFGVLDIPIRNSVSNEVADHFLILGDNGTGKTTVLQGVALALALVCRKVRSVADLDWLGWVPGRYAKWGPPLIELEVHFTEAEITATKAAAKRWYDAQNGHVTGQPFIEPGSSQVVTVRLEGEHFSCGSTEELYQFRGRSYAASLLRTDPSARDLFDDLPGVFWFDQFRNLASPPDDSNEPASGGIGRISFAVGVERLRRHLNGWQLSRLAKGRGKRDYLGELEENFRRIFPGRSFGVPEPMFTGGIPTPDDFYFIINDGNRSYDIQEMSAGEQAVFPILYEFVRLQIRNSIVLIDEVDLNLHPPLAQCLLASLPVLGANCQFLLTTHSEAVTAVCNPNACFRLPGGRLCL